jgi:hypothetical protein
MAAETRHNGLYARTRLVPASFIHRAMSFLGEELENQKGATPFSPRCNKDLIEEHIFRHRRDLFTKLDLVFFDTTSIYFEGTGGETIGQRGFSKDHRPDLKQMVVGAVIDDKGQPICCEMWPGNTIDVKTLLPIVARLQKRFNIVRVCIVADRGMFSAETLRELENPDNTIAYILGTRMRKVKESRDIVLSHPGRYKEVRAENGHVFCSFLALVLRKELERHLSHTGPRLRVG